MRHNGCTMKRIRRRLRLRLQSFYWDIEESLIGCGVISLLISMILYCSFVILLTPFL